MIHGCLVSDYNTQALAVSHTTVLFPEGHLMLCMMCFRVRGVFTLTLKDFEADMTDHPFDTWWSCTELQETLHPLSGPGQQTCRGKEICADISHRYCQKIK